jgi:hypothetical protein
MMFDLQRIIESKRAYRRRMAAQPIEEKLAMLDILRERTLAIRPRSGRRTDSSISPKRPT